MMRKPRVKPVLFPVRRNGHRILLGTMQYGIGHELQDDELDSIWHLLSLMDGSRTQDQIIGAMQVFDQDLDKETIQEAMHDLIEQGFIEDADAPLPPTVSSKEAERYSRSTNYFAWIDRKPRKSPLAVQSILKDKHITIIGVGGTGSAAALSLTAMGIGRLTLVDPDAVELSNLNRQLLYTEADIGKPKVMQAAEHLQEFNPHVPINPVKKKVATASDILPFTKMSDFLIISADEPFEQVRLAANEATLKTQTPWIENHTAGPTLGITMFVPGKTPCYRCALHVAENEASQLDLVDPTVVSQEPRVHGSLAPVVTIVGHLSALEVVHYFMGIRPQTMGKQFRQNCFVFDDIQLSDLTFWKDCPTCGGKPQR